MTLLNIMTPFGTQSEWGACLENPTNEDQTRRIFWAYDGANFIGTPPRLYNQILRKVVFERKPGSATSEATNADFARLFALANVAIVTPAYSAGERNAVLDFGAHFLVSAMTTILRRSLLAIDWFPRGQHQRDPIRPTFPAYLSGHAHSTMQFSKLRASPTKTKTI
jgi:vanadium chloroperoxidase